MKSLAGGLAQLLLPDRQRAKLAQPGLYNDKSDRSQMRQAKPEIPYPAPVPPPSEQYRDLAEHDEQYNQKVKQQNHIRP